MRAVVLKKRNAEVSIEELELDEVHLKMVASGVCHSDYSVITGTIPL